MIQKFIYFLIFIFALIGLIGSPLFPKVTNGLNNFFSDASIAMSWILTQEALIIIPLICLMVIVAFISIWKD